MKQRVVLGLSGGVDSAVAAYLLKNQGYEVIGVFMRNWDSLVNNDISGNPTLNDDVCPQEKDYEDAKKTAEHLGIEFKRVDFVKEYWDKVFTYFIETYKKGFTPNPDILCNKYIKFKAFLDYANSLNADFIATGHYARIEHGKPNLLLKGKDNNKDQTYFLCQLNQQQLAKSLFPLGEITKNEVREIAKKLNLPVANKKDSTGICFIGERDFKAFLQNYIPNTKGDIVDITSNKIIGKHDGIMYHTIGQRKGLNIGGEGDAWFVVGKNYQDNQLYVAQGKDNEYLTSYKTLVEDINWIIEPNTKFVCNAKMRYRQPDNEVQVTIIDENKAIVEYPQGIKAVTPGQECVFYQGDVCLGGGVIKEVYDKNKKKDYL